MFTKNDLQKISKAIGKPIEEIENAIKSEEEVALFQGIDIVNSEKLKTSLEEAKNTISEETKEQLRREASKQLRTELEKSFMEVSGFKGELGKDFKDTKELFAKGLETLKAKKGETSKEEEESKIKELKTYYETEIKKQIDKIQETETTYHNN